MTIRVVVCDGYPVVRTGVKTLLAAEPGVAVVGEAADGSDAVERIVDLRPDVAVVDATVPGRRGIEAARQIHRRAPEVRVLVLAPHDSPDLLHEAIEAGAAGYVLQRSAERDLIEAVRAVCQRRGFVAAAAPQDTTAEYLNRRRRGELPVLLARLTPREEVVLRLLALGYTNQDVARQLRISVRTVETHRAHVLSKLRLHSRADLVRYAQTHGLLAPPSA